MKKGLVFCDTDLLTSDKIRRERERDRDRERERERERDRDR